MRPMGRSVARGGVAVKERYRCAIVNRRMELSQLVPHEWCLSCKGCCRFVDPHDAQTPALSVAEAARAVGAGGSPEWFPPSPEPPSRGLRLVPAGCESHCPALHAPTHRCRIYPARPLDCQLYPFVLTRAAEGRPFVALDTKCPYVQHLGPHAVLRDFGLYLARLLSSEMGQAVLAENPALVGRCREEFWLVQPLAQPNGPVSPAPEGFRPLQDCLEAFEAALAASDRPLSAYHRAAWLPWSSVMRLWWGRAGGMGCLLAEQAGGYFLALPPLGPAISREGVAQILALLHRLNAGTGVSRIENVPAEMAETLTSWGSRAVIVEQEYEYLRGPLRAQVAGPARRARRRLALTVRPSRAGDAEGCQRLYALWALRRQAAAPGEAAARLIRDGFTVHARWLAEADALGIWGVVVERDGALCGYSLAAPLSSSTDLVLAEIGDSQLEGISEVLTEAVCARAHGVRLNTMGDAALPALARAKRRARPAAIRPVFVVSGTG